MSGHSRDPDPDPDPDLERQLLSAAWFVLANQGYAALTLTKVAEQAEAHQRDAHRLWSSKAHLVTDVLAEHLPPVSEFDTGTLRGDIRAYLEDLAEAWSSPWLDGLVRPIADLRYDPDAERAFRMLTERRSQPMRKALLQAIERGEIGDLPELGLTGGLFEGPLMHRRMIERQPLSPEYLDEVALTTHRLLAGTSVAA